MKGWDVILKAAEDGKKAIGDALTKKQVKDAFNNTKDVIDAVEPKENEVNNPILIHFYTTKNAYNRMFMFDNQEPFFPNI